MVQTWSVQANPNRFTIDFPWYGLFRSAEVLIINEMEKMFECRLNNNAIVRIRKSTGSGKWIDESEKKETTLTSVIGNYIDDYLKK